ncbi:MAG: 5'-methylthioadenosine/adenosylhomocysteine nucleosidase [Bacteroidaceae bacterium]|nr:5'-methylthioadenosine/adenosylhomocysteine nucleosidase [Bacteroidaceae bacterium]
MGKTIGVLTAMNVEFKQIASILTETKTERIGPQDFLVGKLGDKTIVLLQCGIGKVNAASGVTNLIINFKPDSVVSTGVAGGIDTCLKIMDVVVSTQTCYHDVICGDDVDPGQIQGLPRFFESDKAMAETAARLPSDVRIVPGLICTGDQFITNREQLNVIKATYPEGLAVDMESAAIAHVCHLYGVPFVSFRIISDTPGAEAHFEEYLNFWQTMADKSFSVTRLFLNSL